MSQTSVEDVVAVKMQLLMDVVPTMESSVVPTELKTPATKAQKVETVTTIASAVSKILQHVYWPRPLTDYGEGKNLYQDETTEIRERQFETATLFP